MVDKTHVIAWVCHYTGLSSMFYSLNRGRKKILTFHNVLPDSLVTGSLCDGVSCRESIFIRQIDYVAARFPIDLNLDDPATVTITFDDGYLNQYEIAHKALTKRDIKAYYFCPLDVWGGPAPLVTDRILFWLSFVPHGNYSISVPPTGAVVTFSLKSDADRRAVWAMLFERLVSGEFTQAAIFRALSESVPIEEIYRALEPRYRMLRFSFIPNDALDEMKAFGHAIGAHGRHHEIMATLDDAELDDEATACAAGVGEAYTCRVFSYPFGGAAEVSSRVMGRVEGAGFERALANINSPIVGARGYSPMFLPRISLPNAVEPYMLSFALSGAKYFLQYRRLFPKVH